MSQTMPASETETTKQSEATESVRSEETQETEDEYEEPFFQDIYLLAEQGISMPDIETMRAAGINTIKGLQMTTSSKLIKLTGFASEKILKIQDMCHRISANNRFMTALEVREERMQVFKIPTGSSNLDNLLGGGVESMAVTQVFGESGTGKTQIAHTLCVTAQLPADGYTGGKVMFIDTEHTFRPDRLSHIARRFNVDETKVLENVSYARAHNSEHQHELLKLVGAKFHEEVGMYKLLIVDSIMAHFRVDFMGNGELAKRQHKLGQMMSLLQRMSEEYNIAVFITNQISSNVRFPLVGLSLNVDDDVRPVGGNILAHASTTRLALKKLAGNVRIAKMYGSPDLQEREEAFIITSGGVKDPVLPN